MSWYDPNFAYKKSIVIPHGKVSGSSDLLDFPVLVSLTDANLKSQANGGLVSSSSGYDLLFTDATETRELPYEVESYTATSGALVAWVRIPMLSATQDTVFYLYFGNATVTGWQATASNVWDSNYKAVYHLSDNAANTTVAESTSSGYTGTNNATTSTTTVGGEIASALSYNGTSDYTHVNYQANLNPSQFTVEAWGYVSGGSGTTRALISSRDASDASHLKGYIIYADSNNHWAAYLGANTASWGSINTSSTITNSSWYHIAATYDGTTLTLYVNGTSAASSALSYTQNATYEFRIGAGANETSPTLYFNGDVDEVRVSKVARTANWLATQYTNQSAPSSFIVVGQLSPNSGTSDLPVLLESSVASSSPQHSADQLNPGARGVKLLFNSTVQASDDPITLLVEGKDIISGQYYTVASFPSLSLGPTVLTLYPGLSASSTVASGILPRTWRVTATASTSESASYTVGASLIA